MQIYIIYGLTRVSNPIIKVGSCIIFIGVFYMLLATLNPIRGEREEAMNLIATYIHTYIDNTGNYSRMQ